MMAAGFSSAAALAAILCAAVPAGTGGGGPPQTAADEMLRALDDIDEMLRGLEDELVSRQKELKAVGAEIRSSEEAISRESARTAEKKAALEKFMRSLYGFGQGGYLHVLLSSESFTETLRRRDYLSSLISYSRAALSDLQERTAEMERGRGELQRRRRRLMSEGAAIEERIRRVTAKRAERLAIIQKIREDPALREVMGREAARHDRGMDEAVGTAATGGDAAGFAAMKGTLPWPSGGVVEAGFGLVEDELYGIRKLHKGWDIRARFLSDVIAVHDGRVVHSGWLKGFGNVLVLDHGGGYLTIYAHLARADRTVGDQVRAGEVVAYVGDTASTKGPFLYFEIRKNGKPLDPADWLEGGR